MQKKLFKLLKLVAIVCVVILVIELIYIIYLLQGKSIYFDGINSVINVDKGYVAVGSNNNNEKYYEKAKITKYNDKKEKVFEKLYNKGYNYTEIARIVGKSRACVTERIKSPAKSKWQNSTDDLTDKQIKMIKDMYNNGASAIDIAKKVGITAGSVKYRLKHMGMKTKYSYVSEKEKKMFINHLHKAGYWRSKEK